MNNTPTHGISIRQPWADSILYRGKDYENRTWVLPAYHMGTPLYLHAGKNPDPLPFRMPWLGEEVAKHGLPIPGPERHGAILGTVIFDRVVEVPGALAGMPRTLAMAEDRPWLFGPFGWHIAKAEPLPSPVPFRGRLGFFPVNLRGGP